MLNLILSIVVSAAIDSTTLFLGDQTDMHLQATVEAGTPLQMPVYGETLIPEIEIVDRTLIDTVTLPDGRLQLNQYLTLTSFKDSLFFIPPVPFVSNGDTIWSGDNTLNVIQPFEVDTTNAITDIKPVMKAPLWLWGILRWVVLALAIIALAIGSYYLAKLIGRYTGKYVPEAPKVPERPAEEVALEKLDKIKMEKIWQAGKTKQYHTELTDVVREYISRRFDISSSEKTSDETLRAMKPVLAEQKDLYARLQKMLSLADLVKFAKWTTTPDENEIALKTAYDFVNETTPKETSEQSDSSDSSDNKDDIL